MTKSDEKMKKRKAAFAVKYASEPLAAAAEQSKKKHKKNEKIEAVYAAIIFRHDNQ